MISMIWTSLEQELWHEIGVVVVSGHVIRLTEQQGDIQKSNNITITTLDKLQTFLRQACKCLLRTYVRNPCDLPLTTSVSNRETMTEKEEGLVAVNMTNTSTILLCSHTIINSTRLNSTKQNSCSFPCHFFHCTNSVAPHLMCKCLQFCEKLYSS